MQKQNILKYASVKCTNPQQIYKNPVKFENSMIYTRTKQQPLKTCEPNIGYSKGMRVCTQPSEPYNQKGRYWQQGAMGKNKEFGLGSKILVEDKKGIEVSRLAKGVSQKQFKFVGNFVNLRKSDNTKKDYNKERNYEFVPFYLKERKQGSKAVNNNFMETQTKQFPASKPIQGPTLNSPSYLAHNYNAPSFLSPANHIPTKPPTKPVFTQSNSSYFKRNIKTEGNQQAADSTFKQSKNFFFNFQDNSKKLAPYQNQRYVRKSFKNFVRKTQNDEGQSKWRMTEGKVDKSKEDFFMMNNKDYRLENAKNVRVQQDLKENKENRVSLGDEKRNMREEVYGDKEKTVIVKNDQKEPVTRQRLTATTKPSVSQAPYQTLSTASTLSNNFQSFLKPSSKLNPKPQQQRKPSISKQAYGKIDWKRDLQMLQKIGEGTFGKVYKAKLKSSQIDGMEEKRFAVKKVFVDKKYKNRELEMVNRLKHRQVMKVYSVFVSDSGNEQYLNIVMDFYQHNLFEVINQRKSFSEKFGKAIPPNFTSQSLHLLQQKCYIYQMLKGLSYIHSQKICHRDIKPHNMLVNEWELVLCDFGSAKQLAPNEANLSYICSRCYRAPELIFGSTAYTTQIDLWSVGCVILEMINGIPLFIGQSSLDHLLEIIKVCGTPSKKEVLEMNQSYDIREFDLPQIKRKSLAKLYPKCDPLLIDLLNKLLVYSPKQRLTAIQALSHPYFEQLRNPQTHTILKNYLPAETIEEFFTFSEKQFESVESTRQDHDPRSASLLRDKIVPSWCRKVK